MTTSAWVMLAAKAKSLGHVQAVDANQLEGEVSSYRSTEAVKEIYRED